MADETARIDRFIISGNASRFQKLEEQMVALKALWTQEEASFDGEFERFDRVWSWPKPVQRPHPPLVLGGETDYTLKRIVRLADGWLPRAMKPEIVTQGIEKLRRFAADADRDPDSISVSAFAPPAREEVINQFRDAAVERVILMVPPQDEADTLRRLDRYAAFV